MNNTTTEEVRSVKDEAKAGVFQSLGFADEHLSHAEIAKEIYEVLGEGGSIALSNQLMLLATANAWTSTPSVFPPISSRS